MIEDFYLGNKTLWEYEQPETAKETAKNIQEQLNIPPLLSKVLAKRGFFELEEIQAFLKPSIKNLHNPLLLPDMETATARILDARKAGEKVIIYGDYDVDGITATSIMYQFLQSIGMDVSFYIPDRVEEGYGISEAAVTFLLSNPFDLMITVDCGISAKDRLDQLQEGLFAQNRKMDIIITDHHQLNPDSLPQALAVVNPQLSGNSYPFTKLCGAGIAFKLVQALCIRLNLADRYLEYVDLAALGTVADIVELSGENRIIVWAGLKKIQRRPNVGIQALLKVSEVNGREIDTWLLSFVLAPRINAAGRMGDASRGVHLFSATDPVIAESIASQMHQDNILRQKIQEEILQKAIEVIEADSSFKDDKVIVVHGEAWHHGVIGIVASLLTERYVKPCFVLSVQGDTATGSARSIEGFNIFSAMEHCRELFVNYEVIEQAGGWTLKIGNIKLF
ncbi:MAG: single-stranded-DNA-specific exonuclease RecJ, partial [Thermoclostridium sp.]|nr:single-stranded-DNA-specific exonuclease RecJ [Thermoclostridium sp.]